MKNTSLKPVKLPATIKRGEQPHTNVISSINAIDVKLLPEASTNRRDALHICWRYAKATWAEKPEDTNPIAASDEELSSNFVEVITGKALPNPMECIQFTFLISGLSTQEVTHLIRHRTGTFAAQCTGDRDLRNDDHIIPFSIQNSPEFHQRYVDHVRNGVKLYADMTDTLKISMMDARMILGKSHATFYIARFNLKDLLMFIRQRQDLQIQPEIDNIIAAKIAVCICNQIPELTEVIDLDAKDMHYIKTARVETSPGNFESKGTNLYQPEEKNDVFDWHPEDFLYDGKRDDICGTGPKPTIHPFRQVWMNLGIHLKLMKDLYARFRK